MHAEEAYTEGCPTREGTKVGFRNVPAEDA